MSFGAAISIMSPFFVYLFITITSGVRACFCLSVPISKSHSTLTLFFSAAGIGLWSQMLSVVLILLCCSPGIYCGGLLLLCLVLYKLPAILGHTLAKRATVSVSHPPLRTSCILDHLSCGKSLLCGMWCRLLDHLVQLLWMLLFLSWVLFLLSYCCYYCPYSCLLAQIVVFSISHSSISSYSLLYPVIALCFHSKLLLSEDLFPFLCRCTPVILHLGIWLLLQLLLILGCFIFLEGTTCECLLFDEVLHVHDLPCHPV